MAGDLEIEEQAIVLESESPTTPPRAAASVKAGEGHILHTFGPRVMIAEVPKGAEAGVRSRVDTLPGSVLSPKPETLSDSVTRDLDETGRLGLEALRLRQSDDYSKAKQERPRKDELWDEVPGQSPDAASPDEGTTVQAPAAPGTGLAQSPTSSFLIGSVAVGLIIVEGPTTDLKFDRSERATVVAEVQNGLSWLGSQEAKAGVSWSYDIQVVTLDTPPGPGSLTFGQKEALWRDPALAKLGYGPGLSGASSYIQDLRSQLRTRWAYCAFFTKYPAGHFAYASVGGPRIVMQYDNDGWGPSNIDRVFAHETGHIFGAPDEYPSSGCTCGGQWGYLKAPNGNCQNCAAGGGVDCIMRSNSWAMCSYTPVHFGWRDSDNDGILDPDDRVQRQPWWIYFWLCRRFPGLCSLLQAPEMSQDEDLVPMSILHTLLDREALERVEGAVAREQEAYLAAIAAHLQDAASEVQALRRRKPQQ